MENPSAARETTNLDDLKIAIVCDWLTVFAGAERVILELHELFPKAPIYTSIYDPVRCKAFKNADVRESALGKIPGAKRFHRLFLPWMPLAFERMDLDEFDIVISSSHAAAKGIVTKPETLHLCYCHSPMRYVWDQSHQYQDQFKQFRFLKALYTPLLNQIREWDYLAAQRVDHFIANSHYISRRIQKYYHRSSDVIHPAVDLTAFTPSADPQPIEERDYDLVVGRLIPYKRVDLAIQACEALGRPLKIVGTGPEEARLKALSKSCTTEFLGKVDDEDLRALYRHAKTLIFSPLEDFGIVPLEAMACGTPVVAYAKGGALETVKEEISGLFFKEQSSESLQEALKRMDEKNWDIAAITASVREFHSSQFKAQWRSLLEEQWKLHKKSYHLEGA